MTKRTYIDTGVLIAAFKAKDQELATHAFEVLDDPERTLVISDAVRLEALPKPRFNKQDEESKFYESVFNEVENLGWNSAALNNALDLATAHGIAAMDAIHVSHAIEAHVDEFVTAEGPTKPMFRVRTITIRSIRTL